MAEGSRQTQLIHTSALMVDVLLFMFTATPEFSVNLSIPKNADAWQLKPSHNRSKDTISAGTNTLLILAGGSCGNDFRDSFYLGRAALKFMENSIFVYLQMCCAWCATTLTHRNGVEKTKNASSRAFCNCNVIRN